MRVLLFAQVAAVALLVSGCPGAPASDPSGGGLAGPGGSGSSSGGEAGKGGSGNGGVGGSGGSGNSGAGGSNTGGSGNGSGGSGAGSGGSGGGSDPKICDPLQMDVTIAQGGAVVCNLEQPSSTQCTDIIDGLCCPIAVNDINSPDVQAYLEALKAFLDAGCVAACPPIPCPDMPQVSCGPGVGSDGACTIAP